ncbi:hypothetical protein A5791_19915 [Mycobacterium sp. 852002-51163_SCH5372311]|uniref:hypothetical protein n=1 Tax=Mycobacterium sp. 852002-51163_SCH5372311 TaxID=1834097 RepID=UPI0008013CDD|nr:hypothetical protein [Mycobacterium sp. 852002-51163_SCH5372311]OBF86962.1 hypothetical protein A5791_19915 [Mycobacterium sp. 852002-51163_SCH5372311]
MPTAHDDTATTWRDLADQLTPEQIRRFERYEQLLRSADDSEELLKEARWEAERNLNDVVEFGHIPLPSGISHPGHWENDGTGTWTRTMEFSRRSVDRAASDASDSSVYVDGVQAGDGAVTWSLFVLADDRAPFTAEQARRFAAMIMAAADELERLR